MNESIPLQNFENSNEKEKKYLKSVEDYFYGLKEFDVLADEVSQIVDMSVLDRNSLLQGIGPKESLIFISNHPRIDRSLCVPAEKIESLKGGNTFNFERFNYPLVRQLMLQKLLDRDFTTVSLDNGWREAMQECWHTVITRGKENRFDEIVDQYKSGESLVIYPEGKSTGMASILPFRKGFFYLSKKLGIKKVAVGVSSPILSVSGKNRLELVEIIDVSLEDDPLSLIKHLEDTISSELRNLAIKG